MIFCADNLYPQLHKNLNKVDNVQLLPKINGLYKGIRNHADLLLCPTVDDLFLSQEIEPTLSPILRPYKIEPSIIRKNLGTSYPYTALLNVVLTPYHLICNTQSVCSELLSYATEHNIEVLHVKQGYTRCTTLHLKDNTFLTDDAGIQKSLKKHELTVFKVAAGHVKLSYHPTGFIGGTAGIIDETIYFNGDISVHPSYKTITEACAQANLKIVHVPGLPLVDIGSILQYKY